MHVFMIDMLFYVRVCARVYAHYILNMLVSRTEKTLTKLNCTVNDFSMKSV